MSNRMTDEMFAAYETDDAAGMLLMESTSEKDNAIVELWGWMQNERAKVDELEARIEVANKLPKKWRWRCGNKKTSTNHLRMDDADELESALEQGDSG